MHGTLGIQGFLFLPPPLQKTGLRKSYRYTACDGGVALNVVSHVNQHFVPPNKISGDAPDWAAVIFSCVGFVE